MRITDIETVILRLPEAVPNGDGPQVVLIIRVHTDSGITGIGEAHAPPQVMKAIIGAPISQLTAQGLRQLLVGRDPRKVEEPRDLMYDRTTTHGRRGAVINAISGIDIALWGIPGTAPGAPAPLDDAPRLAEALAGRTSTSSTSRSPPASWSAPLCISSPRNRTGLPGAQCNGQSIADRAPDRAAPTTGRPAAGPRRTGPWNRSR